MVVYDALPGTFEKLYIQFTVNAQDDLFTTETLLAKPGGEEQWVQIRTKPAVSSLAIDSGGFMYVGTAGNGILRSKDSTVRQ